MEIKKNIKTDIVCKKAYMEEGILYDVETGESIDLLNTIEKVYGQEEIKITVTASKSEEVDIDSVE